MSFSASECVCVCVSVCVCCVCQCKLPCLASFCPDNQLFICKKCQLGCSACLFTVCACLVVCVCARVMGPKPIEPSSLGSCLSVFEGTEIKMQKNFFLKIGQIFC